MNLIMIFMVGALISLCVMLFLTYRTEQDLKNTENAFERSRYQQSLLIQIVTAELNDAEQDALLDQIMLKYYKELSL